MIKMIRFIVVLGFMMYGMYQDQIPLDTCYICASILLAGYMAEGKD